MCDSGRLRTAGERVGKGKEEEAMDMALVVHLVGGTWYRQPVPLPAARKREDQSYGFGDYIDIH